MNLHQIIDLSTAVFSALATLGALALARCLFRRGRALEDA